MSLNFYRFDISTESVKFDNLGNAFGVRKVYSNKPILYHSPLLFTISAAVRIFMITILLLIELIDLRYATWF